MIKVTQYWNKQEIRGYEKGNSNVLLIKLLLEQLWLEIKKAS